MGDVEDTTRLIKPQVHSAALTTHAQPDEAEEKKRRLDEALQRYESKHPVQGVIAPGSPSVSVPETKPVEFQKRPIPSRSVHHDKAVKPVLWIRKPHWAAAVPQVVHKEDASVTTVATTAVFTPTEVDPDAPIPAAVAAAKQHEAELEAERQAEASKLANRYAAPPEVGHLFSKKFIQYTVVWLLAIPLAVVLYHLTAGLSIINNVRVLDIFVLIIEYCLAAYGALGWIPLVVFYIRAYNK